MKEKELNKLLDDLKEIINKIDEDKDYKEQKFNDMLNEELNKSCKIAIEKEENREAKMRIEGSRLSLLLTLAGAEKGILKQLDCDKREFEFIKEIVGINE